MKIVFLFWGSLFFLWAATSVGNDRIEVTTGESSDSSGASEAAQIISGDLEKAKKENPDLQPTITLVKPKWTDPYRIGFAIVRGVVNGTVATWALSVEADVEMWQALNVGGTVGGTGVAYQFFNPELQDWFKNSTGPLPRFFRWLGKKTGLYWGKAKGAWEMMPEFARWYLLELSFVGSVKLATYCADMLHDGTFLDHLQHVGWLAALGVLAQSFWDIGFATTRNVQQKLNPPESWIWIQRYSDLKVLFMSSIIAGFAQALDLAGVPMNHLLGAISGVGFLYYLRAWWKERKLKCVEQLGEHSQTDSTQISLRYEKNANFLVLSTQLQYAL